MKDIEYLASAINKIIGENDFVVYLNTNVVPNYDDNRTVVTLSARRDFMGLPVADLDVETMTVTLTFDLPAETQGEDLIKRDRALETIHDKLLGEQNFSFIIPDGTTYKATSLLSQEQPSDPYIDAGRTTQLIVLTGTIYVANASCKAMVGNELDVYIAELNPNGTLRNDYERLLVIDRAINYQTAGENFTSLGGTGGFRPSFEVTNIVSTKALSFIYTGKEIEKQFIKMAEGKMLSTNMKFSYKVVYPEFIIVVPFKVLSVTLKDAAGVLLQYTLNVQTVGDATIEEVE